MSFPGFKTRCFLISSPGCPQYFFCWTWFKCHSTYIIMIGYKFHNHCFPLKTYLQPHQKDRECSLNLRERGTNVFNLALLLELQFDLSSNVNTWMYRYLHNAALNFKFYWKKNDSPISRLSLHWNKLPAVEALLTGCIVYRHTVRVPGFRSWKFRAYSTRSDRIHG